MSAITELRKKAEEKFPGYPVDFEDGTSIKLKAATNFTESEREAFNERVQVIESYTKEDGVTSTQAHTDLVEALASVADDADKARVELAKESIALLYVIFDEYGKHIQAQEDEGAAKSKGTGPAPRTRRGSAHR